MYCRFVHYEIKFCQLLFGTYVFRTLMWLSYLLVQAFGFSRCTSKIFKTLQMSWKIYACQESQSKVVHRLSKAVRVWERDASLFCYFIDSLESKIFEKNLFSFPNGSGVADLWHLIFRGSLAELTNLLSTGRFRTGAKNSTKLTSSYPKHPGA